MFPHPSPPAQPTPVHTLHSPASAHNFSLHPLSLLPAIGSYFFQYFLSWLCPPGDFQMTLASGKLFRLLGRKSRRAGQCHVCPPNLHSTLVCLQLSHRSSLSPPASCLESPRFSPVSWAFLSLSPLKATSGHFRGWKDSTEQREVLPWLGRRVSPRIPRQGSFCGKVDTFVTLFTRIPHPHHPNVSSISQDFPSPSHCPDASLQPGCCFGRSL